MTKKISVGILGATGMVGQRFITLLDKHPWFDVVVVAASSNSAGKTYAAAVAGRWFHNQVIPEQIKHLVILDVEKDKNEIVTECQMVFSALNMDKEKIREVENNYAAAGIAVVSNNSAHRWTEDVPMIIPEVNPKHVKLIDIQRKNRGWNKGLIVVKPNCSIQSYVPALDALKEFKPRKVVVSTYQAISGAGKTFKTWSEMTDNIIPYIGGEEEKSEKEPLKVWGKIEAGAFDLADTPKISANCIRVPVSDGHMATVNVEFKNKPTRDQILHAWRNFNNPISKLDLPSAPTPALTYFAEDDRPQTKLDRDNQKGMGVTIGRLREDSIFDWKFVCLSHNTIRGAAGGAVLAAELVYKQGYIL
jgi:aspartate-semialdehyde dehydrogenase